MPQFRTSPSGTRPFLGVERLEDRCTPSADPFGPTLDLSGLQPSGAASPSDILVSFSSAALAQGTPTPLPGTSILQALPLVSGLYEVGLAPGVSVAQALAEYQSDPRVQYADPDNALGSSAIPNDPQFSSQWDMGTSPGINAPAAWDITTGSAKVTVAVMDSGIDYNHPDLYDNVWLNQAEIPTLPFAPGSGLTGSRRSLLSDINGDGLITFADLNNLANQGAGKITDLNGDGRIDASDVLTPMVTVTINGKLYDTGGGGWVYSGNTQDGDTAHPNDFIGWNFVNNTNNPYDDFGHGTHVSGTIGAMGNNGTGVAGINWNVQIMPVKFLDNTGYGTVSNFIQGLSYAIQHGAKISNNSWAGASYSQALYDAVNAARSAGQIFVAAAGNSGASLDSSPTYPASLSPSLDNVVTVAATDSNGNLAGFSNYGPKSVALAAPGVNILSTLPGSSYGTESGTSMAAPHVTGVLALVWAQHPNWTYTQVINQVLSTVTPLNSAQDRSNLETGGLLNAAAALGANTQPTVVPPQVLNVSALTSSSSIDSGIQLTFNQPMNPLTVNSSSVTVVASNGTVYWPDWVLVVSGSGNTVFQFGFSQMSAPGTYTVLATSLARDSTGNALTPFSGTVIVAGVANVIAPQVVNAILLTDATGKTIGVDLTFNQPMNPLTVNSSSVTVVASNGTVYWPDWVNTVAGSNNKEFQFGFSRMSAPGTYTVRVTSFARDAAGDALTPYSGIVTAGVVAPQVLTATLLTDSTGKPIGVDLTFNQPMNPLTVNSSSVTVVASNGTVYWPDWVNTVAGSNNKEFQFGFSRMSAPGTYTVRVTSFARDAAGDALTPYSGIVTAGVVAPQILTATLLTDATGKTIGVDLTFNQPMNPLTVNSSSVTVVASNGTVYWPDWVNTVAGSNNKEFQFGFSRMSAPGTYTVRVTSVARDSNGNPLTPFSGNVTISASAAADFFVVVDGETKKHP